MKSRWMLVSSLLTGPPQAFEEDHFRFFLRSDFPPWVNETSVLLAGKDWWAANSRLQVDEDLDLFWVERLAPGQFKVYVPQEAT